jgi:hypothetical protein
LIVGGRIVRSFWLGHSYLDELTQKTTALRLALCTGANFSCPLLGGPQRAVVEQPTPACGIVLEKPILFWPRLSGFNRFVCQYNELDAISIVQ